MSKICVKCVTNWKKQKQKKTSENAAENAADSLYHDISEIQMAKYVGTK